MGQASSFMMTSKTQFRLFSIPPMAPYRRRKTGGIQLDGVDVIAAFKRLLFAFLFKSIANGYTDALQAHPLRKWVHQGIGRQHMYALDS